jgi:RNA polymerase sigma-70 factor (ECF subfamily)
VVEQSRLKRFNEVAVPQLDAAHNLARWLTRNDHDAEDVVQEAYLRAYRFFDGYRGGDARAWILKIVRHTAYSWLQKNRPSEIVVERDEESAADRLAAIPDTGDDPEMQLLRRRDVALINRALAALPPLYREILVLREIEDLSYREIADILALPIGTVMSRLARARLRLQQACLSTLAAPAPRPQ